MTSYFTINFHFSSRFSFVVRTHTQRNPNNRNTQKIFVGNVYINSFKTIYLRSYKDIFPPSGTGGQQPHQQQLSSIYPTNMERGGGANTLDNMTDSTGLCLQDLVGGGGNNATNGQPTNNNGPDHLHNHHPLHDSVSSAVSVSSAITSLMSPSTIGSGLSHLHHGATHADVIGGSATGHTTHHHSLSTHTPSVLHEPLEKLKCKYLPSLNFLMFIVFSNFVLIYNMTVKTE